MSAEDLRRNIVAEVEKLNRQALENACNVRPSMTTTADGVALTVVDQLAMARAYATVEAIINVEYRKLTAPQEPQNVRKIREVY